MDREKVDTFKYVHEMNLLLRKGGLLLVTGSRAPMSSGDMLFVPAGKQIIAFKMS